MSNAEITCPVVDYGNDYPNAEGEPLGQVSYAELQTGTVEVHGKDLQASPLSSVPLAREIAGILKEQVATGRFLLGEPQVPMPTAPLPAGGLGLG